MGNKLLEVEDLRISFPTTRGISEVVRGVSFSVGKE
ncbi:peptide ABC transporter ATP-binding protein, partial [Rhizobium sp. KAs_5_22]